MIAGTTARAATRRKMGRLLSAALVSVAANELDTVEGPRELETVAVVVVGTAVVLLAELDSPELELELELDPESVASEPSGCPGRRGLTPAASSILFT